jgi:methyl-accepting chemotaxis protein
MGRIAEATREQDADAARITDAAAHMARLTEQVSSAAHEQAEGSAQIMQVVSAMTRQTHEVSDATQEQAQAALAVLGTLRELLAMSNGLKQQARSLDDAMAFFEQAAAAPSEQWPEPSTPLLSGG